MSSRVKLKASALHSGVDTIEEALDLMATSSSDAAVKMDAKELGIGLTLIGVAELQAKRLRRLGSALEGLEAELYKESRLQNLNPTQLVMLYRLSSEAMRDSGKYVADITRILDWDRLQERAVALKIANTKKTETGRADVEGRDMEILAAQMLSQMAKQQMTQPLPAPTEADDNE